MSHASLGTLIPAIKDLPDNLIKGFGEVFKFDLLGTDADGVQKSSSDAIAECGQVAATICDMTDAAIVTMTLSAGSKDTSVHKTAIQGHFTSSLATISTVANDPYFGTPALQSTADQLNNITIKLDEIPSGAQACTESVVMYCAIYKSSVILKDGVVTVDAEIAKFKDSEQIETYESYIDYMDYMHILPWIMVSALIFYTLFWFFGRGLCCCCKGGSCAKTLLLIPHVLCCLIFFILDFVFVVIGLAWSAEVYPNTKVPDLKGEPTIETLLTHIEDKFPAFWNTVFRDLEEGLESFFGACFIMLVAVFLVIFYEVAVCICRPYQKTEESEAGSGV